tara:strand:- start:361 stop:831 length:471 start_codon:yes stop_codon:yes gene_type:complete
MAKKPTHLRVVGKEERPLTGKQEAFAKLVAGGAILSDAYRECYSADNMKNSTLWSEACRLAQNPKVSTRIKDIQADMEQTHRTREHRLREHVLKRLQEEADGADNASSRIRALELLGKSLTVSMFSDRIEQAETTDRTSAEIEKDLKARLARLIGS